MLIQYAFARSIAKQYIRLAYSTTFRVPLKITGRMSELRSERKIHTCSECNKEQPGTRQSRNNAKCCCSCELKSLPTASRNLIFHDTKSRSHESCFTIYCQMKLCKW